MSNLLIFWHGLLNRLKSEYVRGVLTLSIGTAIAGMLPVVGTFFMMKIYTPEEFGVLALFIGIYGIGATFLTGRYELAIVLPEKNEEAIKLTYLSVLLVFLLSLLIFLSLLPLGGYIVRITDYTNLEPYMLLIPLSIFFQGLYQSLFYYSNRFKYYKEMSFSKVVGSVSQVASQVGFGIASVPFNGLIVGRVIGQLSGCVVFLGNSLELIRYWHKVTWKDLLHIGKKFSNFPKYLIFSHGIAAVYLQIPVFFLARYYSEGEAGYFSIAMQIVVIPNLLISNALGDVFRQRAAEDFNRLGNFREIFIKTLKSTLYFGIIPFIIFAALAPNLFKWYDPAWETAGIYARYMAISVFFSFIATPVDKSALIAGKTAYILRWHLSFFISHLIIAAIAVMLEVPAIYYIFMIILIRIGHFLVDLGFSYKFSK